MVYFQFKVESTLAERRKNNAYKDIKINVELAREMREREKKGRIYNFAPKIHKTCLMLHTRAAAR